MSAAESDWQDVLYRGRAGTESSEHHDGEGPFKILATSPIAPPKPHRRASDRISVSPAGKPQFNRRAGDRRRDEALRD